MFSAKKLFDLYFLCLETLLLLHSFYLSVLFLSMYSIDISILICPYKFHVSTIFLCFCPISLYFSFYHFVCDLCVLILSPCVSFLGPILFLTGTFSSACEVKSCVKRCKKEFEVSMSGRDIDSGQKSA